tara:strand:+ start:9302 stop:10678 length:1377 start_codon:yes stop_codon:yes gene_type:complete
MADSQFTRLYQIDPSAYEGPSTFEGLGDFLGAVNQYNQQTKAEARYQDSLAAQKEVIALEQERHDDEVDRDQTRHDEQKAFRDKQYNDTVAQQNLVNQKAEEEKKKADQKYAFDQIIQNTPPGSEERLLAMQSGEFDLLAGTQQSINILKKNVTERKRIKDVFSGLGVAEDSTLAEIKDVLTIEKGNLNEEETNYLMGLMKQRYVLEDNIKTSPEYVAAEASLKASDNTSFLPKAPGAQRVLNSAGIEQLTKVREEMARKMGLATTTYAPGAEGLNIGKEIALPYIGGEAVSPVDDEGELTEEASVVATNIADIMTNGDSLESIEGVLENSLNARERRTGKYLYEGTTIDVAAEVADDDRRIGEPFTLAKGEWSPTSFGGTKIDQTVMGSVVSLTDKKGVEIAAIPWSQFKKVVANKPYAKNRLKQLIGSRKGLYGDVKLSDDQIDELVDLYHKAFSK